MTTHCAVIQGPSGQSHRCYVKMAPPDWPTPLTEAVAWLLSDALDLPRPKFAALVFVPIDRLRRSMPLDQHWHRKREALAFCCEAVEGRGLVHSWKWIAHMRARRLFKSSECRRICAFDEWVDNRDRHTGNLIRRSDGLHVPIDNEFILFSLFWSGVLNVVHQSLLSEGRTHLTVADHQRFHVEVASAARLHAAALQAAASRIASTMSRMLPPAHARPAYEAVMNFLTPRAQADWLAGQLGVIA